LACLFCNETKYQELLSSIFSSSDKLPGRHRHREKRTLDGGGGQSIGQHTLIAATTKTSKAFAFGGSVFSDGGKSGELILAKAS
jgi:hypothetical protein